VPEGEWLDVHVVAQHRQLVTQLLNRVRVVVDPPIPSVAEGVEDRPVRIFGRPDQIHDRLHRHPGPRRRIDLIVPRHPLRPVTRAHPNGSGPTAIGDGAGCAHPIRRRMTRLPAREDPADCLVDWVRTVTAVLMVRCSLTRGCPGPGLPGHGR